MKRTLLALAVLAIVATSLMAFATPVAAAEQPSAKQPAPAPQDGGDGDGDGDGEYPSWVADIPIEQVKTLAQTVYDARIWLTALSLFFAGAAYLASSVWQGAPQWAKKVMQNIVIGAVVISMIPWALNILFP